MGWVWRMDLAWRQRFNQQILKISSGGGRWAWVMSKNGRPQK